MKIPGYTLKRKLGQGGMAAVYLAVQESFGRDVALKIMMPHLARESQFAERFMREARTVAQLAHPNIVSVYDVGYFQTVHFIAMEYHTGGDLTQRILEGISVGEGLRILRQLADALDFAHARGIIHRDIKPDNILFRAHNDDAILTDFGIAKRSSEIDLTQAGSTVGTPKYMSPEQARGQVLDGRADLYSLGVILYEMLTGRPPFQADDPVTMAIKHCQDPVPPLPAHLDQYQPLVDRLLAKLPEQRFDSGKELMVALDALLNPGAALRPAAPAAAAPVSAASTAETVVAMPTIAPAATPPAPGRPPARPAPASAARAYEPFFTIEEAASGSFLSKRYQLAAHFSADDYNEFRQQFQKLQEALKDWLGKRGRKAASLMLSIQAHPWIHGQVRDVLTRSRTQNTALGDMLNTGEVRVHLHDELDPAGTEFVLSEAGGKLPAKAADAAR